MASKRKQVKAKAKPRAAFKSSEVLAVAMSLLVDHGAKTCCSAIGQAVRKLTGAEPERTRKGKAKQSMPHNPLYKKAASYLEHFRPTEREADVSESKRLLKPTEKGYRSWWRTPSHPKVYAHKTERLIALSWAFFDAQKAKD
jgi:hypothetical protein